MMYANNFNNYYPGMFAGWMGSWLGLFILPLIIWTLVWKSWALWLAARSGSKGWFIALLILNTAGILDILYIFVFSKGVKKSSRRK